MLVSFRVQLTQRLQNNVKCNLCNLCNSGLVRHHTSLFPHKEHQWIHSLLDVTNINSFFLFSEVVFLPPSEVNQRWRGRSGIRILAKLSLFAFSPCGKYLYLQKSMNISTTPACPRPSFRLSYVPYLWRRSYNLRQIFAQCGACANVTWRRFCSGYRSCTDRAVVLGNNIYIVRCLLKKSKLKDCFHLEELRFHWELISSLLRFALSS